MPGFSTTFSSRLIDGECFCLFSVQQDTKFYNRLEMSNTPGEKVLSGYVCLGWQYYQIKGFNFLVGLLMFVPIRLGMLPFNRSDLDDTITSVLPFS